MASVETAFFCEKTYVMNDGKHMAIGMMPGILVYAGPPQPHIFVDAYIAVRFDHSGKHKLDILVSTEKGQTIAMSSIDCEIADPRFPMQVAIGQMPLPLVDGEAYLLSVKEGSNPWVKACSIKLGVTFQGEAVPPVKTS